MSLICPKCKQTKEQLQDSGGFRIVDGYGQCSSCYADLEDQSVVTRIEIVERAKNGIEPWPEWYFNERKLLGSNLSSILFAVGISSSNSSGIPFTSYQDYVTNWHQVSNKTDLSLRKAIVH